MKYIIGNLYLNLVSSNRAILYKDGKLLFIGNGYVAMRMFIKESGEHPAAIEKFKTQLTAREEAKTKIEMLKAEANKD